MVKKPPTGSQTPQGITNPKVKQVTKAADSQLRSKQTSYQGLPPLNTSAQDISGHSGSRNLSFLGEQGMKGKTLDNEVNFAICGWKNASSHINPKSKLESLTYYLYRTSTETEV